MGLTLMAPHESGPRGLGGGAAVTPSAAGVHLQGHGPASLPYGRASLPVQGGSYVGFSTGSANRRMLSRQGSTVFNQLMYDALPEIGTPGGAPDVPAGTPPPQRRRAVMSGFTPCRTAAARAAAEGLPAAAAMAAAMGSNTTDLSVAFSPIAVARHEDPLSIGDGHGLERSSVGAAPGFRSVQFGLACGAGGAYPGASAAGGAHRRQASMQMQTAYTASVGIMGAAGSDLGPSAATAIPGGGAAGGRGSGSYHSHASDTGMLMGSSAPVSHAMHPGYGSGSGSMGGSYRWPGQRILVPDQAHGLATATVTAASGPAGGPPVRGGRLPQAVGLAASGSSQQTSGSAASGAGPLGSGTTVGAAAGAHAAAATPGRSRLGSGILGRMSDDPAGGSMLGAGVGAGAGGGGSHGQHPVLVCTADDVHCSSALNIELDGSCSVGNNTGGGNSAGMWGFGPMAGYPAGAGAASGASDHYSSGLPPAPTSGPTLAEVSAAVAGAILAPSSSSAMGFGYKLSPRGQPATIPGQAGLMGLRPKSPAGSLELLRGRTNGHAGQASYGHGPSGLHQAGGAAGKLASADKAEKSKWPRAKALLGGKLISSLVKKFKDGVQVSDRK
eukprot:XP_001699694.1 predicted protein [Chlamydomonas reinhardtii]